MIQLHSTPQHYLLQCMYFWGGELTLPVLLETNIDVDHLIKNNKPSYIKFVVKFLGKHLNLGAYNGEYGVYQINDFKLDQNVSLDENIKNLIASGGLLDDAKDICFEINEICPSQYCGFQKINAELHHFLTESCAHHKIILSGTDVSTLI